MDVLCC